MHPVHQWHLCAAYAARALIQWRGCRWHGAFAIPHEASSACFAGSVAQGIAYRNAVGLTCPFDFFKPLGVGGESVDGV